MNYSRCFKCLSLQLTDCPSYTYSLSSPSPEPSQDAMQQEVTQDASLQLPISTIDLTTTTIKSEPQVQTVVTNM